MILLFLLSCKSTDIAPASALTESGLVECAAPNSRSMLGAFEPGEAFPSSEETRMYELGVAVGDVDGDGRLDVVLPGSPVQVFLQAADGSFSLAVGRIGLTEPHAVEVIDLIDLDADADLDMVLSRVESGHMVLENIDGYFMPRSDTGLEGVPRKTRGFHWGDMDGDGDLDLSVANDRSDTIPPDPGDANELFERIGPFQWEDISERLRPEWRTGYSVLTAWFDADLDADLDLYVVNHMPDHLGNTLLRNNGTGEFSSWPGAGLDLAISGMGFDQADLNDDGWPDLLIANATQILVMMSDGLGGWYQAQAALGLEVREEDTRVDAWSAIWADLNSDGRVDVYSGFGAAEPDDWSEPLFEAERDGVWLQQADGSFEDVSKDWGLDQLEDNRAAVVLDLDGDGWLDILKSERKGPTVLYRARCGRAAWMTVSLVTGEPHGAMIVVEAGGDEQRRWLVGMGPGYMSSQPAVAHFGLGTVEVIDALTVIWPDGTRQVFHDIDTRQHLTITSP